MSEEGFQGKATAVFQYMPPGKSVICATVDGKPARREVFVDASTAERLQRDLEEKLAAAKAGRKAAPCGLFDHRDGAACLHPKRFSWDDARGVLLEAEWTQAGKAAVEGKDYLYWSPTFRRVKATGRVMGLQDGVEVGSLVNNPAFESIEPVAAAAADDGGALDGECEDVNCCGVERADAANPYGCNQHEHKDGCPHGGGHYDEDLLNIHRNVNEGKESYIKERDAWREYAGSVRESVSKMDMAHGVDSPREEKSRAGRAPKSRDYAETVREIDRVWNSLGDSTTAKQWRDARRRIMDLLDDGAQFSLERYMRREHENTRASKNLQPNEETMKENNTSNEPGEEVFASKRVCAALVDALEAVSAARSACERCTEQDEDDDEEAAKKHRAELERLKAALDEEQDEDKKAVIRKRIDEMEASNPYGCNQYGHSFKSYHRGFSSNANIAKKKQAKKNAVSKLNEIARKRK